ncbi:class F sortase [Streptomyces sp. NPDC015220]|uniref:class F sortase n=1 Tax=Streptomyces sp. NPDC015220 TaxID=3364947 RepID=UPI0036FEDD82
MPLSQPPPTEQPAARPRRNSLVWAAAAVGLGALLVNQSLGSPVKSLGNPNQAHPPASSASAPASPPSDSPRPTATPDDDEALPRSEPTRISIPDIGVDAPFTKLSLGPSGQLEPPPVGDNNLVGWFQGGASPGERGSSIVVGHVDTTSGPAVFAELDSLDTGKFIDITRADGVVARFEVDAVETYSKAAFPDDKVYADTPKPELRLITCGGTFDRTSRDYKDNVVVFAHLESSRPE